MQKFYDAQYRDRRTGEKASGQELFSGRRTRNKQLSEENLHVYRGWKLKNGRVSIRRQRYRYQPKDLVKLPRETIQGQGHAEPRSVHQTGWLKQTGQTGIN